MILVMPGFTETDELLRLTQKDLLTLGLRKARIPFRELTLRMSMDHQLGLVGLDYEDYAKRTELFMITASPIVFSVEPSGRLTGVLGNVHTVLGTLTATKRSIGGVLYDHTTDAGYLVERSSALAQMMSMIPAITSGKDRLTDRPDPSAMGVG